MVQGATTAILTRHVHKETIDVMLNSNNDLGGLSKVLVEN